MSRDYRLFLDGAKTACEKILRYTHAMTFDQFTVDEKTFDAVVRNLEITGKASSGGREFQERRRQRVMCVRILYAVGP
ncbi:MAG: HepT-like ribonuclease domain-containing protein [Chloroflexota bacterium]